jgi:hypothetical protein
MYRELCGPLSTSVSHLSLKIEAWSLDSDWPRAAGALVRRQAVLLAIALVRAYWP